MNYQDENEFTLVELFLALKKLARYIFSKTIWILLVAILIGLSYGYYTFLMPVKYRATSTFSVSEAESSAGYSSLLGQFGLGGSSSETGVSLDKLDFLLRTENIIYSVFLKSVNEDVLANKYIDLYLRKGWIDEEKEFKDFTFKSNLNKDSLSRFETRLLKGIKGHFAGNCLKSELDPLIGIMTLTVVTEDEELSKSLNEMVIAKLADFYTLARIEREQENFDFVSKRKDSIATELKKIEYQVASYKDSHIGVVKAKAGVQLARLERKLGLLYTMNTEATKNYEISSLALQEKKPFFQMIDYPRYPLPSGKQDWIKNAIIGFIGGLFIGILLFTAIFYFSYFAQMIKDAEHQSIS